MRDVLQQREVARKEMRPSRSTTRKPPKHSARNTFSAMLLPLAGTSLYTCAHGASAMFINRYVWLGESLLLGSAFTVGVLLLLEAFRELAKTDLNVRLTVVGEGQSRSQYERLVRSWKLGWHISLFNRKKRTCCNYMDKGSKGIQHN